jgi:hypothetical protein
MPSYYIYLVSTLPMLRFKTSAPISFERFLQTCARFIPLEDLAVLKEVSISGEYDYTKTSAPALKKWHQFDTALRNELVRIRASRGHQDGENYLRRVKYSEPSITHIAISAYRSPSILEAERMLDEARWRALDEFALGHYFDLDFLILYALKLLILQRWEKITTYAYDQTHWAYQ